MKVRELVAELLKQDQEATVKVLVAGDGEHYNDHERDVYQIMPLVGLGGDTDCVVIG